jgi:hypothetical protein
LIFINFQQIYQLALQDEHLKVALVATEILMLIHTFWAVDIETSSQQRRNYIDVILANFSQMNVKRSLESSDPADINKAIKRAQVVKIQLLAGVCPVLPRFIITCDLDQMVRKTARFYWRHS